MTPADATKMSKKGRSGASSAGATKLPQPLRRLRTRRGATPHQKRQAHLAPLHAPKKATPTYVRGVGYVGYKESSHRPALLALRHQGRRALLTFAAKQGEVVLGDFQREFPAVGSDNLRKFVMDLGEGGWWDIYVRGLRPNLQQAHSLLDWLYELNNFDFIEVAPEVDDTALERELAVLTSERCMFLLSRTTPGIAVTTSDFAPHLVTWETKHIHYALEELVAAGLATVERKPKGNLYCRSRNPFPQLATFIHSLIHKEEK